MKKLLATLMMCMAIVSCSKDDELKLNLSSFSLYVNHEYQITSNGTNVRYESENHFIAQVDSSTGMVVANKIGRTFIKVMADQGRATFMVNVVPQYDTYREPCFDFTVDQKYIESKYGYPTAYLNSGWVMYVDLNAEKHYANGFMFTDGKLSCSRVMVYAEYLDEVKQYLEERYLYLDSADGVHNYINGLTEESATMRVTLDESAITRVNLGEGESWGCCNIYYEPMQ